MDFGLLYENDKGEYVVLNDVRMADICLASPRFACLLDLDTLARIACLSHICVKTSRFHYSIWGRAATFWAPIWGGLKFSEPAFRRGLQFAGHLWAMCAC